jgi:hypothetical protein
MRFKEGVGFEEDSESPEHLHREKSKYDTPKFTSKRHHQEDLIQQKENVQYLLLLDPNENMPVKVKTFSSGNEIVVLSEESRRGFIFLGFSTGKLMGICTKQLKTVFVMDLFLSTISHINIVVDNISTLDLVVTSDFGDLTVVKITPE